MRESLRNKRKLATAVVGTTLGIGAAVAYALQGNDFSDIASANTFFGSRVGWDVRSDGGFVLRGDNNMEATLTVANTRDAGGKKAPVLRVVGRSEPKELNKSRPLLRVNSIENAAGIELTNGEGTAKAGAVFGWSIINDKGNLVFREIRKAGNKTNVSFYELTSKEVMAADSTSFMAQVLVPYCPLDKNGNPPTTREKERLKTCP